MNAVTKPVFYPLTPYLYLCADGRTLRREFGTTFPNGGLSVGDWVLRAANGKYLAHQWHRADIAEQHGFDLGTAPSHQVEFNPAFGNVNLV